MSKDHINLFKPVHFDDFGDVQMNESDRGCILIANHVLDVALEHLLRTAFSKRRAVLKKAVKPLFETTRPLSSFSAKIQLAYALRLLDDWAFQDLNIIRQLRNTLAHSHALISFSQPTIGTLVHQLLSTRYALGYPKRPWSFAKAQSHTEKLSKEWEKDANWIFFDIGFNFLHGYITKGKAYERRNPNQIITRA